MMRIRPTPKMMRLALPDVKVVVVRVCGNFRTILFLNNPRSVVRKIRVIILWNEYDDDLHFPPAVVPFSEALEHNALKPLHTILLCVLSCVLGGALVYFLEIRGLKAPSAARRLGPPPSDHDSARREASRQYSSDGSD